MTESDRLTVDWQKRNCAKKR